MSYDLLDIPHNQKKKKKPKRRYRFNLLNIGAWDRVDSVRKRYVLDLPLLVCNKVLKKPLPTCWFRTWPECAEVILLLLIFRFASNRPAHKSNGYVQYTVNVILSHVLFRLEGKHGARRPCRPPSVLTSKMNGTRSHAVSPMFRKWSLAYAHNLAVGHAVFERTPVRINFQKLWKLILNSIALKTNRETNLK